MEDYSKLTLRQISVEIAAHMLVTKQKADAAYPYLAAMLQLQSIDDKYGADNGRSIVAYFLVNAQTLKGGEMPAIKKELNKRIK